MRYTQEGWLVDLPKNWQAEEMDECVLLYAPEGVGAFQVSNYFKERGDVTRTDLLKFAELDEAQDIEVEHLSGIYQEYSDAGDHFFNWWLSDGKQLIFATYCCAKKDITAEATQREHIIASLQADDEE